MKPLIAFVSPPYAGHLNTQLFLALAAQRRGYRVEVVTGPGKLETVRSLGLPAHCPPMLADGILESIPETPGATFTNPFRLVGQMKRTVRLLAPMRDHLAERWRADRPAAVVADFVAVPAGFAADALSIPWATIAAPAFVLETMRGPPSYMGGLEPMAGRLGALRDKAGWAAMRFAKDMLFRLFLSEFRRLGLKRLRPDGAEAIYSREAILCPGLREFEFSPQWPPQVKFLGHVPFTPEDGETAPSQALNRTRPAVLVSFGTHVPWAKERMVRDTKALAARMPEADFEVSLGDARRAGEPAIEKDANMTVRGFIPYTSEIARFDAVIHHGGAGVALAAIAAGLPSLVCPRDYDQPDCAARVEWHGLGHRIRRIDGADAERKLRAVLREKPPALERFARLAAQSDPETVFFEAIDRMISDGARPA